MPGHNVALPSRRGVRLNAMMRRARGSRQLRMWVLLIAVAMIGFAILAFPGVMPITALALPLLAGGIWLDPSRQLLLTVLTVVFAGFATLTTNGVHRWGELIVVGAVATVMLLATRLRRKLGIKGSAGDRLLLELRDQLAEQHRLPSLLVGWQAKSLLSTAGGASFSGDFLISTTSRDQTLFEVALVDVSGKGLDAGSRSLMLSGALGGLLGAVPPEQFLPAANQYACRGGSVDDFATVVHIALNLASGDVQVRTAGHPPALHFDAWTDRSVELESAGPLLGLIEDAEFTPARGRLRPGDALVLYTDGMVEAKDKDIATGIELLKHRMAQELTTGVSGATEKLISELADFHDDASLVVIRRDPDTATLSLGGIGETTRTETGPTESEDPGTEQADNGSRWLGTGS